MMSKQLPMVSILLPNLNNREYLPARFHSILNQTLTDWELIVIDGYSDDGAWGLIQECAKSESRMIVTQSPRKGIYAGINECLSRASGEYVYIATSDDTMAPHHV